MNVSKYDLRGLLTSATLNPYRSYLMCGVFGRGSQPDGEQN